MGSFRSPLYGHTRFWSKTQVFSPGPIQASAGTGLAVACPHSCAYPIAVLQHRTNGTCGSHSEQEQTQEEANDVSYAITVLVGVRGEGVLAIDFGILALVWPGLMPQALVWLFGAYAPVDRM